MYRMCPKRSRIIRLVAGIFTLLAMAGVSSAQSGAHISLLSSADAEGHLSLERLNSCYLQLAREWAVNSKALPNVVVMHVSKKAARGAMVDKKIDVRHNHGMTAGDGYYELWLVESPKLPDIVVALDNVIEAHFHLTPTEEQRKEVLARALRVQNATISVHEGK